MKSVHTHQDLLIQISDLEYPTGDCKPLKLLIAMDPWSRLILASAIASEFPSTVVEAIKAKALKRPQRTFGRRRQRPGS